jgi:hypothetical protein
VEFGAAVSAEGSVSASFDSACVPPSEASSQELIVSTQATQRRSVRKREKQCFIIDPPLLYFMTSL